MKVGGTLNCDRLSFIGRIAAKSHTACGGQCGPLVQPKKKSCPPLFPPSMFSEIPHQQLNQNAGKSLTDTGK